MLALLLPVNNQAFAQSSLAEIEFWQSVKASQDPAELQAYLDLYPQGKFAPLARIRIRKLSSAPAGADEIAPVRPVRPVDRTSPPPPLELPVFKPDNTNVSNASCQARLGRQGYAEADFSGNGSICLCRPPFELSPDGASCIGPPVEKAIQKRKPAKALSRPAKVRNKPRPDRIKRRSVKRPSPARARAIANSYCRRRYGANLKSVVVKKSKFYCHYRLGDDDTYIGVKKKKFKDVSG